MTVSASTPEELYAALAGNGPGEIAVQGRLTGLHGITLPPGASLTGTGDGLTGTEDAELVFADGAEGVRLTCDNRVSGLRVAVSDPALRALHNDTAQPTLGTLTLIDLTTRGRVELLAKDALRTGHVTVDGLHIEAADARAAGPRPYGFDVHVRQGAFTLYNQQTTPDSLLTADLIGISAGREGAPVRGGGVFVSGTERGGRVEGPRLHTGAVYSDGGIPEHTPGEITGGVFVVWATIREVVNEGPVTTYGANDMVLDLWGEVEAWTAREPVTSHGASGIGFVNFGSTSAPCAARRPWSPAGRARAASTSTTGRSAPPSSTGSRPTRTPRSASRSPGRSGR